MNFDNTWTRGIILLVTALLLLWQNYHVLQRLGHGAAQYFRKIRWEDDRCTISNKKESVWVQKHSIISSMVCENPLKEEFYTHRNPDLNYSGPAGQHTEHFVSAKINLLFFTTSQLADLPHIRRINGKAVPDEDSGHRCVGQCQRVQTCFFIIFSTFCIE